MGKDKRPHVKTTPDKVPYKHSNSKLDSEWLMNQDNKAAYDGKIVAVSDGVLLAYGDDYKTVRALVAANHPDKPYCITSVYNPVGKPRPDVVYMESWESYDATPRKYPHKTIITKYKRKRVKLKSNKRVSKDAQRFRSRR